MIADLSLHFSPSESVNKILDSQAASLGFGVVFSNLLITTKTSEWEKQLASLAKSVVDRNGTTLLAKPVKPSSSRTLEVFGRVTLALQQTDKLPALIDSHLMKIRGSRFVECFCVRPATEAQLLELLTRPELYDMLSIDVSNGNFFQSVSVSVKAIKAVPDVVIELEVSQSNRGSSELMNFISQTKLVVAKTTAGIVSSGAKSPFEMKSPIDLISLADTVLGLRGSRKRISAMIERSRKRRIINM